MICLNSIAGWSVGVAACVMMVFTAVGQDVNENDRFRVIERPLDYNEYQHAEADVATVRPAQRDFDEAYLDQMEVPAGFEVSVFARDLENPRIIRAAASGRIFVTERDANRVRMLYDSDGNGEADVSEVVAEGLSDVHGLAINGDWLYMVGIENLWRARIAGDGMLGEPELLRDDLPNAGQHPNRTIDFDPDERLYVTIGSMTNAVPEQEPRSATIMSGSAEAGDLTVYAEGLRNTIGFDWHPQTGQLWAMDHGSDMRGNDVPPEELNRIEEGGHYGWPFCFGQQEVDYMVSADPEDQTKQEFCATTEPMVMGYTPHAAPMQFVFYSGDAFPEQYRNDAFVTMRGSWNREPASGYEVVRVDFDDTGQPTSMEPFVGRWLVEEGRAHFGRIVGLAQTQDGALLVTDDTNGMVYRIAYTEGR